VKAIGECGLDYKRNYSSKIDQLYCFKKHLDLACEINMPMFLHERDAHQDFLKLLKEYINKIEDVVVHCFTGDKQSLKNYLDLDCYIGITGWITDPKRGSHLHDIIKYIPSNKLMIETDSPYLMPYNFGIKNKKYNEPSNLIYILETISNILKKDKSLLTKEIYNNTCKFFNLYDE
jgi:TatD DNase family protein